MNLTELFDGSLRGRADKVGLEYSDADGTRRTLTFGDVEARANRMARELAARGLGRGDRLCIHLTNRIEYIDIFLACTRLGVILVPMNILYRERELRHIVTDADPKGGAVVVEPDTDATYPDSASLWNVSELSAAAATHENRRPDLHMSGADPALIVTHRAPQEQQRARCCRTTTSPQTPARSRPLGASPTRTATSPCCRSFMCTGWRTVFTVGSRAVASCAFSSVSTIVRRREL